VLNKESAQQSPVRERSSLRDLARLFLKLGAVAFGGPPAHIAMMEDEVVARRAWLSRADFLDFLGAANLIPGPTSTEMAIHVGRVRRGWLGLLVAGWSFILPSTLFVTFLAWTYARYGASPKLIAALYGVKPVVIAVIVQAIFKLGTTAVKSLWLGVLGTAAIVFTVLGANELMVLLFGGLIAAAVKWVHSAKRARSLSQGCWSLPALSLPGAAGAVSFTLGTLFLVFFKIGATLFGGGYLLVAFMRADLVTRLHWITEHQLLDAIAAGQVTPGPLSTTATFVGYLLGGIPGALVATAGIFLPAFGPLVPRIRRSEIAGAALDGVNVTALALMIVVTGQLARAAFVDPLTIVLGLVSLGLLFRYRANSAWLVLAGAIVGACILWLRQV
jgi:chromate transporter